MKAKKKDQYKHLLNILANGVTLFVEGVLFAIIWYNIYAHALIKPFWHRGNYAVIGFYVLILFFFTKTFGGYRIGYMKITDVILSHVLAVICGGIAGYFEICMVSNDYLDPRPLLIIMLIEIIFIVPWVFLVRRLYVKIYPARRMLVIYGKYSPDDLVRKINVRRDKYDICAMMSCYQNEDELYHEIQKYEGVVLCDLPGEIRNSIMKFCFIHSIRVYVTPKLSDIIFRGADDIHLFDTPLYLSRNQGLTIDQLMLKRFFDIVLSLIGLAIASPFMLIIAIGIKACDGGPVFYSQPRLTRDGEEFQILKFRSMYMDSEKNGARLAAKGDDRITPVGRIIRRIHFDEIPQIINILKGDMSLVGPRPERKEIADKYAEEIPEFHFRLKVKAGLTGYAQVYGKYNTTPYDKLKLDLTYIENYSLWLDLKIILLTVKILFQKENTEGVDKDQTTAQR